MKKPIRQEGDNRHKKEDRPSAASGEAARSAAFHFTSAFGTQPTWRDTLLAASRSKMMLWTAPTLRHRSAIGWLH